MVRFVGKIEELIRKFPSTQRKDIYIYIPERKNLVLKR